jgi:hypothetical protein
MLCFLFGQLIILLIVDQRLLNVHPINLIESIISFLEKKQLILTYLTYFVSTITINKLFIE